MAFMIALNRSVMASPEHVACDLDDETVILSLKTGEYYGLNPVAAEVWRIIHVRRSVAAIRDALLKKYAGVTKEQCEEDLMKLLAELESQGLVQLH
jgi:coenzyme PQQ synthesis protein D (PqqD)